MVDAITVSGYAIRGTLVSGGEQEPLPEFAFTLEVLVGEYVVARFDDSMTDSNGDFDIFLITDTGGTGGTWLNPRQYVDPPQPPPAPDRVRLIIYSEEDESGYSISVEPDMIAGGPEVLDIDLGRVIVPD
ncbi:MAG: hypothetical protein IT449_04135 [Phycisphaerales bacterium]|nr:hypothetical protein [Phycisphaerales bacterium]